MARAWDPGRSRAGRSWAWTIAVGIRTGAFRGVGSRPENCQPKKLGAALYGCRVASTPKERVAPRLARQLTAVDSVLGEDLDLVDSVITGDHSSAAVPGLALSGCRVERAHLIGADLTRSRLTDCIFTGCDLSGTELDECIAERVEFRDCRLSAVQADRGRFTDVAFSGCKLDEANFRMSRWERAQFESCEMVDADFSSAALPGSSFRSCDLTGVHFSKSTLTGSHLAHSTVDRLEGADALRGASITSDLIVPVAMALLGAMAITIDDDR